MSTHMILIALGAILTLAGIVGGGLTLKEIKIPALNKFSRIMACIFGVVFIAAGIYIERVPSSKINQETETYELEQLTNLKLQQEQKAARLAAEEADLKRREQEAARLAAEETDLKRREQEAARLAAEEADQKRREQEAARLAAEEADQKRREQEAARLAAEEADQKRREQEAARLAAEEADQKRREQEAARLAAEEADQKRREQEAARLAAEEAKKAEFTIRALNAPKANAWYGELLIFDQKTNRDLAKGSLVFGPTTYNNKIAYARISLDNSNITGLKGRVEATEAVWGFMGGSTDTSISIVFGNSRNTPILVFNKLTKDKTNGFLELRGVLFSQKDGQNKVVAHIRASCRAR